VLAPGVEETAPEASSEDDEPSSDEPESSLEDESSPESYGSLVVGDESYGSVVVVVVVDVDVDVDVDPVAPLASAGSSPS
jgi:hypothetical protein